MNSTCGQLADRIPAGSATVVRGSHQRRRRVYIPRGKSLWDWSDHSAERHAPNPIWANNLPGHWNNATWRESETSLGTVEHAAESDDRADEHRVGRVPDSEDREWLGTAD